MITAGWIIDFDARLSAIGKPSRATTVSAASGIADSRLAREPQNTTPENTDGSACLQTSASVNGGYATSMSTTAEPVVDSVVGALMEAFRLPDVSGQLEIDQLPIEQCADFAYEAEHQLASAAALFAEICAPVRVAMMQARARVDSHMASTGGSKMMRSTFDVVREQPKEKSKDIVTLLSLRQVLPADVCEKVFTIKAVVKGAIGEETLAALRAIIPGKMLDVSIDADGTQLNTLARQLGPESDAGKIIAAGYKDVPKGNPVIKFVPRESAIKKASAA